MTAQTARLLVDGNGQIIPNQYYDVVTNSYVVGSATNGTPFSYSTATITSRSGTIATGATAQSLMVANAARKGWFIQKLNPTGGAASFQILTEALNARTANDSFGVTVSSTTPNGTGLQVSNEFYTIPEGWGLRYEGETVNIAMNFIAMILESANT